MGIWTFRNVNLNHNISLRANFTLNSEKQFCSFCSLFPSPLLLLQLLLQVLTSSQVKMSALNAILKEPVIPLIRKKAERDIYKVTLVHSVTMNVVVNGTTTPYREKRTASLVIAEDDDLEVLIRLGVSFIEACQPSSLSLPDGMLFSEFRKCLGDIVLDTLSWILTTVCSVLLTSETEQHSLFLSTTSSVILPILLPLQIKNATWILTASLSSFLFEIWATGWLLWTSIHNIFREATEIASTTTTQSSMPFSTWCCHSGN